LNFEIIIYKLNKHFSLTKFTKHKLLISRRVNFLMMNGKHQMVKLNSSLLNPGGGPKHKLYTFDLSGLNDFEKLKTQIFIIIFYVLSFVAAFSQTSNINKGFEKGKISGDYKIGLWQYFDSTGTLELEIDYTKGKLIYLKRDTTDYVIFKNGKWVRSKVDIPPRFIGSTVGFYDILNTNVDYPMQARYRDVVGTVYILFEVDTNGRATNFEVLNSIGGECDYEFERVLHLIPNYWLVAEKDGKRYRSRFLISCEFGIIMDGKRLKKRNGRSRKHKIDTLVLPLARELDGISYIIKKGYNPKD